jgi:hypothetical protein
MPATKKRKPVTTDDGAAEEAVERCDKQDAEGFTCQKVSGHPDAHIFGDEGEE